ncbi:MAG: hypothetical protein ABIA75_07410, partial [Candidatus Neomarinimicrobiota bacterium]
TSWQNRGHAIGYEYGPDCRSIAGQIDYQLNSNWQFSAQMTWLQKGANSLNTAWAATGTRDAASLTAPVSTFTFSELTVTYFAQHALFQAGYSSYPLAAAEIDGVVAEPAGSFFLRTQLIWDFGFNLDGPP